MSEYETSTEMRIKKLRWAVCILFAAAVIWLLPGCYLPLCFAWELNYTYELDEARKDSCDIEVELEVNPRDKALIPTIVPFLALGVNKGPFQVILIFVDYKLTSTDVRIHSAQVVCEDGSRSDLPDAKGLYKMSEHGQVITFHTTGLEYNRENLFLAAGYYGNDIDLRAFGDSFEIELDVTVITSSGELRDVLVWKLEYDVKHNWYHVSQGI